MLSLSALTEVETRSMTEGPLHLAVLGPLQVTRDGEAIAMPRSKKARALLAYLGVTGRSHTRGQLCDLFWDVADDPRNGLRWCLSRLRTVINLADREALVADRVGVSLARDQVAVDMRTIEARLSNSGELPTAELEDMAKRFRGPFLEGLELADLHTLRAWLIAQRSLARELQITVLTRLLARLEDDPGVAVTHVRKLIQLAPHEERWHAKHVQLLFNAGRKQEAEEQFQAGTRELNAQGASHHALRLAWRRLQGKTGAPASLQHTRNDSPFVGRRTEIARLESLVDDSLHGRGGVATVAGEPGIGKSRLVRELASRAGLRGVLVLEGKCADSAYPLPYLPFVEALDEAARDLPEGALAPQIPLLCRFLPGLAQQHGVDVAGAASEEDRYAVFRAVAALLTELASDHGLLLVLEDLHWADTQSLLLVSYLARALINMPGENDALVLLVATYRDVEVSRAHPLRDTLVALQREPQYQRVALKALHDDDARTLIAELTHAPRATVDAIYAQTEGHPLFIEEVAKHLVEEQRLDAAPGRADSSEPPTGWSLPEGIRDAVGRRLSRMSKLCNRMLANASAITGAIHWPLLREVCGGDEDELLDALDEALAAQLVRGRPGARGGSYEFTHALIRQALYEELSASRRTRLHKKVGEAIEQVYAADTTHHLVALAHHFNEAAPMGDLHKFLDYSIRAGQQAMMLMAFEEAAQLYKRALATLDELEEGAGGLRGELHELYGKALATMSQWVDASTQFEAALAIVAEDDDHSKARLLLQAALCAFWMLDTEGVRSRATDALALAKKSQDPRLEAAATAFLSQANISDGELGSGMAGYAAARKLAGPSDDLIVAQALQQQAIAHYWRGEFDAASIVGARLLTVARSHSDGSMVTNVLAVRGMALGCAGRYRESAAAFREAEQFGRDHGIVRLLTRVASMRAGCIFELGALELAREQAQLAVEQASQIGFAPAVVSSQIDLLLVAIAQSRIGDAEALLPTVASAVSDTRGFHTWVWSMRVTLARAQIAWAKGNVEAAAENAEALVKEAKRSGRLKYVVAGQRILAAAHRREGRHDEAAGLLREAAALAQSMPYPALLIQVVGDLLMGTEDADLASAAADCVRAIIAEIDDAALRRAFEQSGAVRRIVAATS
jgi:DNA-binding SARP family transcriptional activator